MDKKSMYRQINNIIAAKAKGYDYLITDELGGVHTDGVGYAPDGHFCGECTKSTCVGCWDDETEQCKQNLKTLFQEKEQYYKLSTLYSLAYEDDVNGNCDGKVDVSVVACLASADVEPVRHAEWVYDHWCEFKCSHCGNWSNSEPRAREKYCSECGAKMDGGKE